MRTPPRPILCPVCLHAETIRSRQHEREIIIDYMAVMICVPPPSRFGACGNPGMPLKYHNGAWVCQVCELRLDPHEAGVLLDAALSCAVPDCDSFDGVTYADTRRAFRGWKIAKDGES